MNECIEYTTPRGFKYRYFKLGFRRLPKSDVLVPRGWPIERQEGENVWVYDACMHPDDVEGYLKNLP